MSVLQRFETDLDFGSGTGNEAGVTGVLEANLISVDSGIICIGEMVARIPHFWTSLN